MLRICEQAANIHMHTHTHTHTHTHAHRCTHNCMLFTSITSHLLVPVGQLDVSLHPHLANIHSHCQDNMLSKIHAEPERTWPHKRTLTKLPQTAVQVHTHATPAEEVRLAFCCYCNSVIPHCRRPNSGQGVAFCSVCTLCGWQLAYPSSTQVNAFCLPVFSTPHPPLFSRNPRTPSVPPRC